MTEGRGAAAVYVGLGSNLAGPEEQLQTAIGHLNLLPRTRLLYVSSFYHSRPHGPEGQPDYVNAVAALNCLLEPEVLLDHLQTIEQRQGREPNQAGRWGPRTLDLDILVFGKQIYQSERLTIPHPQMVQREFVLYPLLEIAPDLNVPGFGSVRELAARCPLRGLRRIERDIALS
jgi:2-amino-4-hydroxy-6-hydroxymethyldihydropteridine diphosphokinase